VNAWRYLYAGVYDGSGAPGAGHGDEIALAFGTIDNPPRTAKSAAEEEMSTKLRTAWTEFAKDPEGGLLRLGWPLYDEASESGEPWEVVSCDGLLIGSQSLPSCISAVRDRRPSRLSLVRSTILALSG
jgi:hypothetical protein